MFRFSDSDLDYRIQIPSETNHIEVSQYHIGQHGSVHPEDPGPDLLASPAAAAGGWAGDRLEAQAHEEVWLLPCRDRGVLLLHRDCQRRQSHPAAHWQWILSSR